MPGTCVIGLQWGDEAKGKIVDLLTDQYEVVVRYLGGANAGHTVVAHGKAYKLSLMPSGVLRPNVQCVVTGGVVLYPPKLLDEIDTLRREGVQVGSNLMVSDRAHVVFPWHMEEERVAELRRQTVDQSGEGIGTTMRGIGPCYRDKAGRSNAVRLGDLYRPGLAEKVRRIVEEKNLVLSALSEGRSFTPLVADDITAEYLGYAEKLKPFVADTTRYLLNALEADKKVLFEGAQGALLDVDHGTYPYVTSSNASGVGIPSGSGVPACHLKKIIGVVKAYCSRVGGGPFPTEEFGEIGEHIRQRGREFGTVTGRPRRCGWFDAVAARYTTRLSGVSSLAVMLLDVLSELPEIKICTAYRLNGEDTIEFPSHVDDVRVVEPVFETLPGWQSDVRSARRISDLPANARRYLDRIQEVLGRPIEIVSVGPDRDHTIFS